MQTIELFIEDEEDGVFAISLVESPATEETFVALSTGKIDLKAIDDERRIVVGYALIPDKEIYRKQIINGEEKEFNIKFSKETVAKASELYMKQLNQANVTSEHERPVTDCCVIESWMTEDKKQDKINLYGIDPIEGGWAVMMKLDNPEEYAKAKAGEYKGFSIEAMFQGFDQLASKQEPESEEDVLNKIKDLLNG